jgi:hypothetical protein
VGNGIYGEMWAAALVAAAFTAGSARETLEVSLQHIPASSRLAEALRDMLELHVRGTTWDEAVAGIHVRYRRLGTHHQQLGAGRGRPALGRG